MRAFSLAWASARFQRLCVWTAASAVVWLGGCASSGSAGSAPVAQSIQSLGVADAASSPVSSAWWRALGSEELNQIVAQALQGQPSLAVVQARTERMLAMADLSRSATAPQMTLGADVTRQRYTENGLYPKPIAGGIYSSGNVQVGVGWSPDLFGQHTAEIAAALGQVQAARADAAAAAVSLAAQVSRGYIALARWVAQRDLAQRSLAQRSALQALTQQRAQAGLDSELDQQQARIAVLEARAQVEWTNEQVVLTRHQLATLAGLGPTAYDKLEPQLARLQLDSVPLNLGADLLGRRADVVAARWRVEAATQEVKVAQAQFYPNVNLGAFVGVNAIGLDQLFDNGSRQIGIAPALRLPLFDGGRLRAQLRGREGDVAVAVASYNSVLLDAVKEASDAISSSQSVALQQRDQAQALRDAEAAYRMHEQRYQAGVANRLAALNAQSQWLAQQRTAADLQARALDTRVALMKALGGGWQDAPEEHLH